ncbi:MAG: hypothetical protein AB9M60_19180, partial [Leptothrix sp. (in: b-proteobacteria)]
MSKKPTPSSAAVEPPQASSRPKTAAKRAATAAPRGKAAAAPLPVPGVPPLDEPTGLLGGLSPATFMRKVWHKQPLLVRQALPGVQPPITRAQVFQLAASDEVESRLVVRHGEPGPDQQWSLER